MWILALKGSTNLQSAGLSVSPAVFCIRVLPIAC